MSKNGCSIYLWANKYAEEDFNAEGNPLAVIAGFGFTSCTEEVDQEVMSFKEAIVRIREKP